jgi:hypothetical protein
MLDFRLYCAEKAAEDRAHDRERMPREPTHDRPMFLRLPRFARSRRRR